MRISKQFVLRLKHLDLLGVKCVFDHSPQRSFFEHVDLHEVQEIAQGNVGVDFFVGDQSDQIHANGNPDLRFHCIERVAKEVFDHQVLLEPFEEQFDLPALLVNRSNGQCSQVQTIAQERQIELRLLVKEFHFSQDAGIGLAGLVGQQLDGLISTYASASIEGLAGDDREPQIVSGSDHETALTLGQGIQTGKVDIPRSSTTVEPADSCS